MTETNIPGAGRDVWGRKNESDESSRQSSTLHCTVINPLAATLNMNVFASREISSRHQRR